MTRKRKPPTPAPPAFDDEPTGEQPRVFMPQPEPALHVEPMTQGVAFIDPEPPFEMPASRIGTAPPLPRAAMIPLEPALAIIDEYVRKCGDGSTLRLEKVIELRERVAKL